MVSPNDVIYMHKSVDGDGDRPTSLDRLIAINFIANESAPRYGGPLTKKTTVGQRMDNGSDIGAEGLRDEPQI